MTPMSLQETRAGRRHGKAGVRFLKMRRLVLVAASRAWLADACGEVTGGATGREEDKGPGREAWGAEGVRERAVGLPRSWKLGRTTF